MLHSAEGRGRSRPPAASTCRRDADLRLETGEVEAPVEQLRTAQQCHEQSDKGRERREECWADGPPRTVCSESHCTV